MIPRNPACLTLHFPVAEVYAETLQFNHSVNGFSVASPKETESPHPFYVCFCVRVDRCLIWRNVDTDDATFDLTLSLSEQADNTQHLSLSASLAIHLLRNLYKRQEPMLKISIVDSGAERRLVLEGALVPPSVMDLRTAWLRACAGKQGRRIVLVFRNVTYISAEGEAALWELMNRGVRFSSGGVPTKHALQQLVWKNRPKEPVRISQSITKDEL